MRSLHCTRNTASRYDSPGTADVPIEVAPRNRKSVKSAHFDMSK
jgi:hypothetical protein